MDVVEATWDLTPDERVEWAQAVENLDPDVAAATALWIQDSMRDTPSISLFMATYRQRRPPPAPVEKAPRLVNREEWFADQRQVLAEGAFRRKVAARQRQERQERSD